MLKKINKGLIALTIALALVSCNNPADSSDPKNSSNSNNSSNSTQYYTGGELKVTKVSLDPSDINASGATEYYNETELQEFLDSLFIFSEDSMDGSGRRVGRFLARTADFDSLIDASFDDLMDQFEKFQETGSINWSIDYKDQEIEDIAKINKLVADLKASGKYVVIDEEFESGYPEKLNGTLSGEIDAQIFPKLFDLEGPGTNPIKDCRIKANANLGFDMAIDMDAEKETASASFSLAFGISANAGFSVNENGKGGKIIFTLDAEANTGKITLDMSDEEFDPIGVVPEDVSSTLKLVAKVYDDTGAVKATAEFSLEDFLGFDD